MALRYGADYNPEQWPELVWDEDIRLMREAGVNIVTVGVFSWAVLEPEPDRFEFGWLDRILDKLHGAGIEVDLATATASPPPWLPTLHPEILPEDENGVRSWPGSRQHYAPCSPVYREHAARLVRRMAERYGTHPAVVMWHINNEYGCHTNLDYSEIAAAAFRAWLERRYGDIDALNAAWGTAFWSQRYTSFAQILPPRTAPTFRNPTQRLDFRRFSSDALLECFLMEKAILRELTPTIPVTTNFIGAFKPVNYWEWAPHLDVISDDSYPDPHDPRSAMKAALTRDLMRSLGGGKPWLLMEQAPGAVQWRQTNAIKATGQMQAWSLQAVSRGADGICFFQWRQSVAGAEKFHSAMVPHAGTGSRIWRSVTALGRQLESLAPVQGTRVTAEVAILLDWNNWWAIEGDAHPRTLDFLAGLEDWYASLYRRNVAIDFAHPAQDLNGYQLVIAPNLYLLSRTNAQRLAGYVASGGTLVVSYFSAIVDDNDHAYLDGYLDALQPVLGIRIAEFAPLASAGPGPCSIAVHSDRLGAFEGTIWSELVELQGAEVVAQFAESDLAGRPAVTHNDHGAGHAWYVATQPPPSALDAIIAAALGETGVAPATARLPEGVEAQRRGDYLFLINQGVVDIDTGIGGHDILTGRSLRTYILGPRQTVVLDLHE